MKRYQLTRTTQISGARLQAGAVVALHESDAADLLESGAIVLLDEDKTMKTYRVLASIHHNHEKYGPGDEIELTDEQAAAMAHGQIEPFDVDEPEAPTHDGAGNPLSPEDEFDTDDNEQDGDGAGVDGVDGTEAKPKRVGGRGRRKQQ